MNQAKTKKISLIRILIRLFPMALATSPLLFIAFNSLGIVHGVSIGLQTFVSQLFFDATAQAVIESGGLSTVMWMAGLLGFVVIGMEVINGLHNFMGNTFYKKALGHLSMRIHEKASRIDPIAYENPATLDDINKANEGMNHSFVLLFTFLTLFTFYIPYFLFMGVYLYALKPLLAVSLVFIFVPVVLNQWIKGTVFARLEDEAAPLRRQFEYYERCISDREYFKETRMLGAARFFTSLYHDALKRFGKKNWEAEYRTGKLELMMKCLTLAGYFGVLYLLFAALLNGEISVGAFAAVFASIGSMFNIMTEIVTNHIGNMTKNLGTVRNFIRFLDLPEREGKEISVNLGNGMTADQISFRYPGAEKDAVTDVTLEIKKGETIAIVGENGAGKTTLIQLLLGLYLPTKGAVYVDGHDTRELSPSSIYKGISAVFQNYVRYKMTLADNIRISEMPDSEESNRMTVEQANMDLISRLETEPPTADSNIVKAAEKADLHAVYGAFPKGYETMLSREFDGVDLSGGQWQRVAVARGFYRTHDFIVLDEPTAAIDPLEETRIYQKFAEISEGKTAIIVTHRLGSARIADRIIVMDQGRIAEIGTHDELIRKGGKYAEMYHAQAQWYVRNLQNH